MKDLESLRAEIDQLDEQLWEIIAQRISTAQEIGEWKRAHGEQVLQPERYQQVLDRCLAQGKQHSLTEALIREVMESLHKESVRIQS